MKSSKMKKMKKRILAMLLCTTMMLNTGVSALADEVVSDAHVHTETCYEKHNTGNLICTKAEVAEAEAHVHTDECYEVTSTQKLTCTQEETAGHSHSDSCVETKDVLTCGTDEHTHGGECYTTETKNVCGQEESETHTHDASCVEETETLTCSVSEHTHGGECYTAETNIVCGQKEVEAHAHGEGCYTAVENKTQICTLEEAEAHTHSDDCYEWEEKLICTIGETALAKQVKEEPVQKTSVEGTKEAEKKEPVEVNIQNADETGITVSIKSTSDVLAEDAKVVVAPMEADEEIETALAEAAGELDVLGYVAYDISLKNADDTDVSLGENKVDVAIDFAEAIPEGINAEEVKEVVLAHITADEEGNVAAETVGTVEVTEDKKATKAELEAASFSPYVVTWLGEVAEEVVEEPVEEKEEPTVLTWEDETIFVTLSAEAGVVPEGAILSVTPILEENEETQDKYAEVAEQLADKVAEENEANNEYKEVAGFLAYDIKLVITDENGIETKVDPAGDVKVTMEYKESAIPEEVKALENAEVTEVTLMHHKEDENGVVENVINMVAEEAIEATVTTVEEAKVENAEFVTDSFSVFTITWIRDAQTILTSEVHYGYLSGNDYVGFSADATATLLKDLKISSTGTPPTLYMDTITETGENSGLYTFKYNDADYYFNQAYIATLENGVYTITSSKPIIALQAKTPVANATDNAQAKLRYMLKDSGTYTDIKSGEYVFFVYSTATGATMTAGYYLENGTQINNDATYQYTDAVYKFTNGVPVEDEDAAGFPNDIAKSLSNNTYQYAYTLIIKGGEYIVPTYMRINENGILQYRLSETETAIETEWIDVGTAENRLIYISNETIETEDTAGLIDINLYDYPLNANFGNGDFIFSSGNGQNDNVALWNRYSFGGWTGDYALQNIVKNSLYTEDGMTETTVEDNYMGYPVLSYGMSLAPLFGVGENSDVTKYEGLNHLFQKDAYGYYVYDSTGNAAYYNPINENKNFVVYSDPSNYQLTSWGQPKDGQFMPFVTPGSGGNGRYHFGMNVGFNFTQPQGGKIGEDAMVFEFTGDDDVWVFIDGKLVLDLGGIHDKIDGSINFKTGDVIVNDNSAKKLTSKTTSQIQAGNTTLAAIFDWTDDKTTFEDGTTHRLEFFYFERGQGESNCKLKFNIPPQESNTIEVAKEIINTDYAKYANIDFDFKVYLEDYVGAGQYDLLPEGTPYTIKKDGVVTGRGRVGANGIFTLRHGESAVFENINPALNYYVEEVDVHSDEFDKVIINGGAAVYKDSTGNVIGDAGFIQEDTINNTETVVKPESQYIASTEILQVGKVSKVEFQNRCSTANKREIKITKELANGNPGANDSFSFKIYLSNTDGELVPYVGTYYIKNTTTEPVEKTLSANANGVVSGIKVGDSVVITGVMSGTEFNVEEVGINTDDYKETYTKEFIVSDETNPKTGFGTATIKGADGAVVLGKDVHMVITNYKNNSYKNITFTKIWDDYDNEFKVRPDSINVTLVGKNEAGETIESREATVYAFDNWKYVWKEVPVYDNDGEKIIWTVEEDTISGYTPNYNGKSETEAQATVDKITVPKQVKNYEAVTDAQIPGNSTTRAMVYRLRNGLAATTSEEISTYAASTYAGGRPGGSSSSGFNHFDIQANGSYQFEYAGKKYTVDFDFYGTNGTNGKWILTDETGNKVNEGPLDVTKFKITNTTTGEDITTEGEWQNSNISGQSKEFRIEGSFDRSHKFNIYFEIPIEIPATETTPKVTINLVSSIDTYYADEVYNICPGGGIDVELDTAIDEAIAFNVVALEKSFEGLDVNNLPDTRFELKNSNGTVVATFDYSDFANGLSGSTSVSDIAAGIYTITEIVDEVNGYDHSTKLYVGGAGNVTYADDYKSATFTIKDGTIISISYVNVYNKPTTHEIMMQKVWVDNQTTHPEVTLRATLSNGETWTENLNEANGWKATKTVENTVTITDVSELGVNTSDYKVTKNVSANSAVVINTLSTTKSTSATVTKIWDDENNTYGKRPESIQVVLYQTATAGTDVTTSRYDTQILSTDNNWTYTFVNLPKSITEGAATVDYSYFIQEVYVPYYTTSYTPSDRMIAENTTTVITNTLDKELLDEEIFIVNELQTETVTLTKYWNDADNKYGSRPNALTLNLLKNGTVIESANLYCADSTKDKWSATIVVPKSESSVTYGISETFPKAYDADGNEIKDYYEGIYEQFGTTDVNGFAIVNTPNTASLEVTKIWVDGNDLFGKRPANLQFKLQYRIEGNGTWSDYSDGTYTMEGAQCMDPHNPSIWKYTIDGLPITDENGNKYEYKVVEIEIVEDNYNLTTAGYTYTQQGATTMVNSIQSQIIKTTASVDADGNKQPLEGAVFTLSQNNAIRYYGKSDASGIVSWFSDEACIQAAQIANGEYTLAEKQAPVGYVLSTETWSVKASDGLLAKLDASGKVEGALVDNVYTYYFENEVLYELPSTGGNGIHVITLSGLTLMLGATYVWFMNRRKEML